MRRKVLLKKTICLVLTACLMLPFAGCGDKEGQENTSGETSENGSLDQDGNIRDDDNDDQSKDSREENSFVFEKAEKKEYPLYSDMIDKYGITEGTIDLIFINGVNDIPYIESSILAACMNAAGKFEYDTELLHEGNVVSIYRKDTEYWADIDFENNTITFQDYNAFYSDDENSTLLDMVSVYFSYEGEAEYLARGRQTFNRYGKLVTIDLNDYNINLVRDGDDYYIPLQTFNDLFMSPFYTYYLFNQDAILYTTVSSFDDGDGDLSDMGNTYYLAKDKKRSSELIEYNYNELCLFLDVNYGLKNEHNITSFDDLFYENGLDVKLKSDDPEEEVDALYTLCDGFFGDSHSNLVYPTYCIGSHVTVSGDNGSKSTYNLGSEYDRYLSARKKFYPDGVPFYEEFGNTAFVTLDSFSMGNNDYYKNGPDSNSSDTVGIAAYAHKMINRKDSPIENVVIDLSCNGGGEVDAAAYLIAWVTGECDLNIEDVYTGAESTTVYFADLDFDHEFDEEDTLTGKNLFCLISPCSFSCGNLVPSAFRESNSVTLLGRKTGGGACIVQPGCTADGTLFRISGRNRMSALTNGSYGSVDSGIEPDLPIVNLDHFYDRRSLTGYINGLF